VRDLLWRALRRVSYSLALVISVVLCNFLLIHLAPGDAVDVLVGQMGGADAVIVDKLRVAYGLDKSLPEQLIAYLGQVLHGNLGESLFFNASVTSLILQRLPATLLLVLSALCVALVAGTYLGILAARHPNTWFSNFLTVVSVAGYAVPVFWLGLMLLVLFASIIPIAPVDGMYSVARTDPHTWARVFDIAHHMVLPVTTLALIYMAQYSRLSRTSMVEVLGSDYIRTARAKGLRERTVIYKHALRNAVIPVVTVAGMQFGELLSGAILVETVYNWPGMGRLAFDSILRRDTPTLLGILFFSAALVTVANLLVDFCYQLIDPRMRLGSR
jgi:peptide/nickel transport system permease protein